MRSQRFAGATALVTGAARGVGKATAAAFAEEGANVVLVDVDEPGVRAAAEAMPRVGGEAVAVGCDVSSAADVDAAVGAAVERFGALHVLVNAAGVISLGRCADLPEADWDRVIDINAKGVFLTMRRAIPELDRAGGGAIVNVASQAGKRGEPEAGHYCASKAAVILLSRSVALEVAPRIRVNCVCPGYVDTDLQAQAAHYVARTTGESAGAVLDEMLSEIPMGRFQQPIDVARLVLFLASDDASEITGEDVNISGGLTTY